MPMNPDLVMISTFLAVTVLAGLALMLVFGQDAKMSRRLDELRDPRDAALRGRFNRERRGSVKGRLHSTLAGLGSRVLPAGGTAQGGLAQQFLYAGIYAPSGPSIFAGVRFVVGIIIPLTVGLAGAGGLLNSDLSMMIAGVAGLLGLVGTNVWLRSAGAKRQRLLRASLPDFLDLMVACLGAGQSFEAALARVTDELRAAHPILALELEILQRELTLGSTPAKALRSLADRTGLDVVRQTATVVDQASRFGASMTESLRVYADLLRKQRTRRAETLAHQAGVKILLPTLLFVFPPVLVILVGPAALDVYEKFVKEPPRTAAAR